MKRWQLAIFGVLSTAWVAGAGETLQSFRVPNDSGLAETAIVRPVDADHPFFRKLGTNGRACVTCHRREDGWGITPRSIARTFAATGGTDPLFRPADAAVSPVADVSTMAARRAAYALLIERGLIRVGLPLPAGAQFTLERVDDPYGFASAAELSLFRRPLPTANLAFLSTVMWDGRETSLAQQASGAVRGHTEATQPLTSTERERIVAFETSIYHAQTVAGGMGRLDIGDARGGTSPLIGQAFFGGINDPRLPGFDRRVFQLFGPWSAAPGVRQAIARGEALFNERVFLGAFGSQPSTCSTCHNAPNAGSSSIGLMFNIGVSAQARRTPDLPLYTLRCTATGHVVRTTDPGLALVSGRCADIGRFKVPTLRGLASRAPYFHDGSAATVEDVVAFYDRRFGIGLTADQQRDLAAFLRAL